MEDEQLAVQGEETPAPSASETESAPEAETSEADTLDQPAEEATGEQPKSRATERIREAIAERNYWKDLALQNAPLKEEEEVTEESDGIGVKDIAKAVISELEAKETSKKVSEAQRLAIQDAAEATRKYPELDTDERLARRVLAIAQADGISISEAADEYIGSQKAQARSAAETNLRTGVGKPVAKTVSTGQAPPVDLSSLSESEKEANWGKIVAQMSQAE